MLECQPIPTYQCETHYEQLLVLFRLLFLSSLEDSNDLAKLEIFNPILKLSGIVKIEAPRVVDIRVLVEMDKVLDVATETVLGRNGVALLEVVDYLMLQLVHCIDAPALSDKLEVIDQRVSIRVLMPSAIQEITRQVSVVANHENTLIGLDTILFPIVCEGVRPEERIHQEFLLVLLFFFLGFGLFIVQIVVKILELLGLQLIA